MKIAFAPMEGITGFVFRRAHSALFSGVSEYYLPFIATHATRTLKTKEREDVSPEKNANLAVVPQLLSKNAEDFLWYAEALWQMGYRKVNLNLGCPSPTVTAKGKGAALLGDPEALRRFLDEIFAKDPGIRISVKTRLGIEAPSEIFGLLEVYNSFPLDELIVHGRTLSEAYRGAGHPEYLPEIFGTCRHPLSYNGNIFFPEDAERLQELCPDLERIMIGRGLIRNPALAREIAGECGADYAPDRKNHVLAREIAGECVADRAPDRRNHVLEREVMGERGKDRRSFILTKEIAGASMPAAAKKQNESHKLSNAELSHFLKEVYKGYRMTLPGPVPTLGHMKELWYYIEDLFETPEPGTEAFRALRDLKKARSFSVYETAEAAFLAAPPPRKTGKARWQSA